MANGYILNQVPTGYGQAMSLLAEMLVSAGWTYKASGDGLSGYSSTGKIFASTGTGALGWNNAKAWARVQDPGGGRELIFQHDAAGGARIKYTPVNKFTAGSPSATVTPSATGERYLRGAASDATPSYGATFFSANVAIGTVKFQGCAKGTAPYGFWVAGATTPAGALSTGFVMDPVISAPEDVDPVVFYISSAAAAFSLTSMLILNSYLAASWLTPGNAAAGCYAHMDVALASFLAVTPLSYVSTTAVGNAGSGGENGWIMRETGLALNPFNSKHEAFPIPYVRVSAAALPPPIGLKGWSTLMRWTTLARVTFVDTLDNKNWISVGMVWLPWDGTTTPTN